MRFTVVLSGLFAALAYAADSGSATQSAPATSVSLDPAQQSQYNCLHACAVGDVNCQAHCIAVPSPDQSQVNATTACAAKCPQGNGTPAQTNIYAQCIDKCIKDNYYVTSEGTPSQTAAAGDHAASGTGTDTAAAPTGTSGSGSSGSNESGSATGTKSGSATKTGSASSATTTNAAPAIIASGGAIFGVIAALLAL